jgi:ribA/ribD-fused uncharacterized protein
MITEFTGKYRWLSNFHPCDIRLGGILYPSAEHAYQAQKTADEREQRQIAETLSPGNAKKMGQKVTLRGGWEGEKKQVMLAVLMAKFRQHEDLIKQLWDTGDEWLVEGNHWHDNFWGSCTCFECSPEDNPWYEQGWNWLGKLLMITREVTRP